MEAIKHYQQGDDNVFHDLRLWINLIVYGSTLAVYTVSA